MEDVYFTDDRVHIGLGFPKQLSALQVNGDAMRFEFPKKKPCRWWRLWQWVFLGWRWIDL